MMTMAHAGGGAAARPGGRLTAEVSSFIGRDREIRAVKERLSRSRLVTLTGVGGVGKTRLGMRVAGQLRRAFRDGVWQVDLAGLRDPSVLAHALLETWGIAGVGDVEPGRLLADYVSDRELLLFLDNCEHLLDACAALAASLLRAGAGLRVLCTSRQALDVVGEAVFEVASLPVPPVEAPVDDDDPAQAAVTLFEQRASASASGFAVTPDIRHTVVEICDRLDGLPLAIELAAAQLRTLSVAQVAAGLTNRFQLLAVRHAAPKHHRTLRATFDWSFALCTPAEQALWTRLAVFAGSFDLAAATAVCADEDLPAPSILDVLAGLIDKSVVLRADSAGQARYRLLDSVREYGIARQRATGGLRKRICCRHADWYLRRAEHIDATWFGPDQAWQCTAMRADRDNVRAALGWLLATPGHAQSGLRLAAALRYVWTACGALNEGRYWLARALAADSAPTAARAAALSAYTRVLMTQGNHTGAAASADESLRLARELDDPALITRAIQDLGMHLLMLGEQLPRAQALLEEALEGYGRIGHADRTSLGMARLALAITALYRGDRERAEQLCDECYAFCQEHVDQWHRGQVLLSLALIALANRDPDRATEHLRHILPIRQALGDTTGIAQAIELLGRAATASADYERSARLTGAAHRIWREVGRTAQGPRPFRLMTQTSEQASGSASERDYEAAYRQGYDLSLDDAIAYARGAEPGPPATPKPPASSPLTPREQQVAELIAEGLSNKQIGTRLVISQRTAESHVENILRKLGFTSRARVATWLARHRPT
jgi:predicted ATPase/DNA-binding CsgD family transcriptional regulator